MSSQNRHLSGKFAFVTGASRGIGRGIALRLAERGAAVAINYRQNESAALEVVSRIKEQGGEAFAVQADVSNVEELAGLVEKVQATFGAIDIFVNNALGDLLRFMAPPLAVTLDQWETAFRCQSLAFLVGVQHVAPLMRDGGRIVAISYWPGSQQGGFSPSFAMGTNKAALEAMCRYFAVSLAKKGYCRERHLCRHHRRQRSQSIASSSAGSDAQLADIMLESVGSSWPARRHRWSSGIHLWR